MLDVVLSVVLYHGDSNICCCGSSGVGSNNVVLDVVLDVVLVHVKHAGLYVCCVVLLVVLMLLLCCCCVVVL